MVNSPKKRGRQYTLVKNCYINLSGSAKDIEIFIALRVYQPLKKDFAPAISTDILNIKNKNVRSYQKYMLSTAAVTECHGVCRHSVR